MKIRLGLLLLALAFGAGACAEAHLAEGQGRRARTALDAQIHASSGAFPIYGDDAEIVMQRQRGIGVPAELGGLGTQGGAASLGYQGLGSSGSLGSSPTSPIRLNAVR